MPGTQLVQGAIPLRLGSCFVLLSIANMTTGEAPALLTSFPRLFSVQGKYDEEIEVYKHHLEQTYKLCRPCQAAVEYYIKHQNRQLRALLLSHHFRRRETDKSYSQVHGDTPGRQGRDSSATTPAAGKGGSSLGSPALGAWVRGCSFGGHRRVAIVVSDASLRFSSCWCHSAQLAIGKSNVIIEWKENNGTGREGEEGKPIYGRSAGNYRVQGERRKKKEQWELNYDSLLVLLPCLTLASAHVSAIAPC